MEPENGTVNSIIEWALKCILYEPQKQAFENTKANDIMTNIY